LRRLAKPGASADLADIWAGWASEIAADAFSFVHTGFASIAALHDVLDGDPALVFRHLPGDPHPISYLRVLLGVEMLPVFLRAGPWDALALSWTRRTSWKAPRRRRARSRRTRCSCWCGVRLTIDTQMRAFQRRALRAIVIPERVSPSALNELGARLGNALFTSAHWLWAEPLRIVA